MGSRRSTSFGHGPTSALDPSPPEPGTVSVAGRRRVLLVAVGVTIALHLALLTAQAAAAVLTGSVAIAANALHIGVDTGVHLVALGGVWLATRPADPRHPYGYERYEALASLLIGMLLLVAVGVIVSSALPRLADPKPGVATEVGLAIMAISAASTASLALYLRRKARQTQSRVLGSEAIHAAADALISIGVLAAVAVSAVGFPRLDPIVALGVAGVVAWRGWVVARGAAEVLTDAATVDTDAIRTAALAVPGVRDCHAVRSRGEAGHVRVDLHIHVAPELTIVEAHEIAREVESAIRRLELGIAEVLVHLGADQTVS
jgi:cation diffusion facilitator family transporter